MAFRASDVSRRCIGRPCLRIALSSESLPSSMASSRRSLLKCCRILVRARGLLTNPSQSCVGPEVSDFDVKISITSPLDSVDSSGTSLPLTLAPMHLCPTSVCTAYAKSTGVDPDGSAITSPFGVKT